MADAWWREWSIYVGGNGCFYSSANNDVDGRGYELRLSEESAGTQKLMGLAAFLLAALERGGTVVVDELDAKLHPKLLRYVILLFKDPEVNKHGAC